ncbi:MAG: iron chaperone [Clostridia bacterium]|nr:iron chaperone [Clostridia bacterium]
MKVFEEYLNRIDNLEQRAGVEQVLSHMANRFPVLETRIAWNQPMFTDHGTFIIGFSVSKNHLAIAPEREGIIRFSDEIIQAGYDHTKELIRISWNKPVDFTLLERIIEFNILEKKDCKTFWRTR